VNEREAILKCIVEHPDDSTSLNVFADFLEESGNAEGAQSIRDNLARSRGVWMFSGVEELRGRTVISATYNDYMLAFETDAGAMAFSVEGDCCSESWWHRFDGVNNLIGATVLAFFEADQSDIDENDGRGRQETESIYAIGIITDKGTSRIVFRNSSNGYYGGWIKKTDISTTAVRPLTDDWISPIPEDAS